MCGDIIALRNPTFGNYSPEELGNRYFDAHDTSYIRSSWDRFEGLIWLLSSDSNWLPDKYREVFIQGICNRDHWARDIKEFGNPFLNALWTKYRNQFRFSKSIHKGLNKIVSKAIISLGIIQKTDEIIQRLLDIGLVKSYYDYQDWLNKKRRNRS